MPPLFDKHQQLDESELVDSLANKSLRSHNVMLISKGFNLETGYLATFVEHCERSNTTDKIAVAKFSAWDENSDTKRQKKRFKFNKREENVNKRHKKKTLNLLTSLWWKYKSHL